MELRLYPRKIRLTFGFISAGTAPSTGSGPAAPSKRREQVRHAQRYVLSLKSPKSPSFSLPFSILHPYLAILATKTYVSYRTHRQRTQNYIKTLESEVVRLREAETNLLQERDKLKGQIETLRTTVILSNIQLPEGVEDIGTTSPPLQQLSTFDMPATVSYANDALDHPRLHVNFPQRQEMCSQGMDYPTQTYPVSAPYQGHEPYANVAQSSPDLPNGWWPIPYHRMNVSG